MRINVEARLRALKASFLILAAIALLAIFPAFGLPNYMAGEITPNELETQPDGLGTCWRIGRTEQAIQKWLVV